MVRRYIQILTATGMRPTEPLYLKHRHIEIETLEDGREVLKIYLPQGKTGKREIVSQPVAVGYYKAIKQATGRTDPDDWVFCDKTGKRSKGYYRTIEALLKKLGLRVDPETGKNRTAYSFRHYYAEQRIAQAGLNLATTADLRANMGTGLEQLERHYVRKKVYNKENLVSYKERKKKA
jgi:integrase